MRADLSVISPGLPGLLLIISYPLKSLLVLNNKFPSLVCCKVAFMFSIWVGCVIWGGAFVLHSICVCVSSGWNLGLPVRAVWLDLTVSCRFFTMTSELVCFLTYAGYIKSRSFLSSLKKAGFSYSARCNQRFHLVPFIIPHYSFCMPKFEALFSFSVSSAPPSCPPCSILDKHYQVFLKLTLVIRIIFCYHMLLFCILPRRP